MSNQQHSRLGQILINKGLISAAQLDAAIQAQLSNHKRLGETLIEQGLLSERQLKKALKKQTNLRLAATLVAALLSPFQMASADIQRMQPPAAMSRQELPKNLRPLTDVEMSNVNAQGLNESLEGLFLKAEGGDGLAAVKQLAKLVMPVLDSLEAETSMSDVRYETGKTQSTLNPTARSTCACRAVSARCASTISALPARRASRRSAVSACNRSTCPRLP